MLPPKHFISQIHGQTFSKVFKSLEQAITFKTSQIIILNKRNKKKCKFFAFDFITASSYCHHDFPTMSSLIDMKK